MIFLPILLIILPKTFFDHGPTTCIYTLLAGVNCYGCGMTRASMRLIHLDFVGAWEFNKLSFIVFPALAFYYMRYFIYLMRNAKAQLSTIKDTSIS
jgi:hypothetical protein